MSDAHKERCTSVASGCFQLGMPALQLARWVWHRLQKDVQGIESDVLRTQQLKYPGCAMDWRFQ